MHQKLAHRHISSRDALACSVPPTVSRRRARTPSGSYGASSIGAYARRPGAHESTSACVSRTGRWHRSVQVPQRTTRQGPQRAHRVALHPGLGRGPVRSQLPRTRGCRTMRQGRCRRGTGHPGLSAMPLRPVRPPTRIGRGGSRHHRHKGCGPHQGAGPSKTRRDPRSSLWRSGPLLRHRLALRSRTRRCYLWRCYLWRC